MKIQNKKEIELSTDDITMAIMKWIAEQEHISLDCEFKIDYRVVNKPIPIDYRDNMDNHVFDGARVVINHE